jgi:hypothetical protein
MIDNIKTKEEKYPLEIIDLPSQGLFYPKDNTLSNGKISLRMPTGKHEDILTSRNLITKGIVIDEFLKALIASPINYEDLLLGDKSGIIVASRILLYGPQYSTKVNCLSCTRPNSLEINIADLETKEIDLKAIPEFVEGTNEFEFTLPHSKKKIMFKFITQKDEQDIQFYLKQMKKHMSSVDAEMSTRLSHVITEVAGERNKAKISKFVSDEMPTKDTLEFRKFLDIVTPGINNIIDFTCNECGYEAEITMPMDMNFFWPSGRS